ncbi:DUF4974 domain-containing protein [Postechiella marina]|uniref:DUF4974 domain-containing protein n=1 Tax=Postechiella marina TaxID=943941 RepID=A0ABP8C6I9_9FLAO
MNTNEVDKKDFQELIEKYLDGKISLEEIKLLVNYYESYQQEHEWVEALGSKNKIKQRMLINILDELQNEDKAILAIPFYKKPIFKYAVAATIALLIALPFIFESNIINNQQTIVNTTINNNIEIGTSKATLTLGDNSVVRLEKGKQLKIDNIFSNGQQLVYNKKRPKTKTRAQNTKVKIEYNYLTIPRGGEFYVVLADGTEVWLNSETQLKYPTTFVKGEERRVELVYGEAYFHASPSTKHSGSKFKVINKVQDIEVLGTEFNIKAYKDEDFTYTTLIEGAVKVNNGSHTETLKPNEQSILNNNNKDFVVAKVDTYSEIAWKRGLFSFKRKTLKEIAKVLSRWYDVNFVFENKELEDVQFKGVISRNQNIEEILIQIQNTNYINAYEINDNTISLKN